jgi:hypothetical protein
MLAILGLIRLIFTISSMICCKYSVKRHIDLYDGLANIVSFIDYIAGRRQGVYFPNPIPNYLLKQIQSPAPKTGPLNIMKDEMFRAVLRKRLGNL